MSNKDLYYAKVKVTDMKELLKKQKKPHSGSKKELFDRLDGKNVKKLAGRSQKVSASVKTNPTATPTASAYKKAHEKMSENNVTQFLAGNTNTWAGLKVSSKVLAERNKYIKKLKNLDKEALKKLGSKVWWNPRYNWAIFHIGTSGDTPNYVVRSLKSVYENSVKELKDDLEYLKTIKDKE